MKSADIIAETLGINTTEWPPSTKAGARYIASEWMKAGGKVKRKDDPLLIDYCLDFWGWEHSDYVQGKIARGQHLGKHWCHDSRVRLANYIKPRIPELKLQDVTAKALDRLQLQLRNETKLSAKTINSTMNAVCTPIREAYRLGIIPHNPAQAFRALAENAMPKGILTTVEMEALYKQQRLYHVGA